MIGNQIVGSEKYLNIALLVLIFLSSTSLCDIYLHNPRGSNNRLNEETRERKNGNRLFDSQNNNRGGYNVGNLYFYSGSKLRIEWTNQHSCSDQNVKCEIILQYACHENLRDGAGPKGTKTIPSNNQGCLNQNCTTDYTYGMHEDYDYYARCKRRQRNQGLFTADQKLRLSSAIATRQNPNGQRYGYECPEERDYYPYWHPSPWKDIAVLTDSPHRCDYYRSESANVKERWDCQFGKRNLPLSIPNSAAGCEKAGGNWTLTGSHGLPAPECREPEWTRDNHLGNTKSGYSPSYNWTIPSNVPSSAWCSLRIRYNISSSDYKAWSVNSSGISSEDFARKFGFASSSEATNRGYNFKGNPVVKVFGDVTTKLPLELAINTQQVSRVFQDRSHAFRIKSAGLTTNPIHNINVRGKRGNIVQVYPSVEYDFTPNKQEITTGDYVHFQWTGSNTNPRNNDGQGALGTDRSNVLLQAGPVFSEPRPKQQSSEFGLWSRSYPAVSKDTNSTLFPALSRNDGINLAFSGSLDARENLDSAATYFDLGPRKITKRGTYRYMSSRNNDFSNRSQKGLLVAGTTVQGYFSVGSQSATLQTEDKSATLAFPANTFSTLHKLHYEVMKAHDGVKAIAEKKGTSPPGFDFASDFLFLGFGEEKPRQAISVTMKADTSEAVAVFRGDRDSMSSWENLNIKQSTANSVTFLINQGGVFVVRFKDQANVALIVCLVLLGIFLLVGIVGLVVFVRRNPNTYRNFQNMFSNKV